MNISIINSQHTHNRNMSSYSENGLICNFMIQKRNNMQMDHPYLAYVLINIQVCRKCDAPIRTIMFDMQWI